MAKSKCSCPGHQQNKIWDIPGRIKKKKNGLTLKILWKVNFYWADIFHKIHHASDSSRHQKIPFEKRPSFYTPYFGVQKDEQKYKYKWNELLQEGNKWIYILQTFYTDQEDLWIWNWTSSAPRTSTHQSKFIKSKLKYKKCKYHGTKKCRLFVIVVKA